MNNVNIKETIELITKIEKLIETATDCKNSYFWKPNPSSHIRKQREQEMSIPEFAWTEGGHEYSAKFDYQESRNHVYACGIYYRDGKKTTLTAIKNSLKRLQAAVK